MRPTFSENSSPRASYPVNLKFTEVIPPMMPEHASKQNIGNLAVFYTQEECGEISARRLLGILRKV